MKDITGHPLQSRQWGEFRKKTGIKVIQEDGFQMTVHKIPHTPWTIGYVPKGQLPNEEMILKLRKIGKQEKCIFIQLEPNVEKSQLPNYPITLPNFRPAAHPLFTKFTFILDLTKSEDELLRNMHPKTRYNIKVAEKHGVKITEDDSDKAFEEYLKLTKETTSRQGFFAHTQKYHRLMWETLKATSDKRPASQRGEQATSSDKDRLTAHLFLANYKPSTMNHQPITLVAWILFVYKDTLYYPYGASSTLHRETMASNLLMWEAIKFGKKLGLKKFDMWGALGPNPNPKDSWYGFHRFKQGYGPQLVEFIGSYDLVINSLLYNVYKILDKIRWIILRFR